jgi:hypothetical protein
MQDPRFVVGHVAQQYVAALDMLRAAVEKCPDQLWGDEDSKPTYWHEAYHALFWCDNFVGDKDKAFELCPVGVDIDPRLFRDSGTALGRPEMLKLLGVAISHVKGRLEAMADADLYEVDCYGEEPGEAEFDVVLHRLLYGLRHCQHHVGKLSCRLWADGVNMGEWRG